MGLRSDTLLSRIRWSGALVAAAALTALVAVGPPGSARAATATGTGYDQITGAGTTNSAITVPWTQGLLDNTNKPIAAANADRSSANPTSPWSFMYQDFKNLQITVSQTQDITHQGVTVTWTGGQETNLYNGRPAADFLQLMECYGDSSSGPSPQQCEFGDGSMLGTGAINATIGTRVGDLCAVDPVTGKTLPPSTDPAKTPGSLDGSGPQQGCDPAEPLAGANPPDTDPTDSRLCVSGQSPAPCSYTVPFVPVSAPSSPAYSKSDISQYFNALDTNEVQEAVTNRDGTGLVHFETLTNTEAPGLGCGQLETNHQPRNCWLVIVPRGTYEPNGWHTFSATQSTATIVSSPLSASNWAMRIQIHLAYAPIQSFCPIGTQETETVGTQIVARAMQSWQLALNNAAKCATIYGYSAVPEATSTQQLSLPGSGVGLAFTTIPIGNEAARSGSSGTANLPPLLYAPVAVSAEGFGFNINDGTAGYINSPVHLSPDLLAKGLTQAYLTDLPDYYLPGNLPGPAWAAPNQTNISEDPEFKLLNPGVPSVPFPWSLAPLLTEDHSALNQQIWQWIQGDSAASAWLNQGTSSATNHETADPDYTALKLGTPPAIDSFPRAYTGKLDLGPSDPSVGPVKEMTKDSIDLLPYVNNYDEAASNVLTANNTTSGAWSNFVTGPDGSQGWWEKNGAEPIGSTFIWSLSDTPDLAAYGLIDAQLCNDSNANCVAPSTASLTAALNSAKPDSAGLLQVDPASPGAGGYPMTVVTYAAVATNQSAAALTTYANLIAYAAGTGQTPGVAPGDLPPGYLPLPASLKAQAATVVKQLLADAKQSASPSPSPTRTTTSAGTTGGTTTPAASGTSAGGSGQVSPAVSATPTVGLSITPPSAQLAAARTGKQPVGAIRWALLVVVMAGAACAAGGTVLRSESVARWLRRLRP
jgi:hypothetical protein